MNKNASAWLWTVSGRQKTNVLLLLLIQVLQGALSVFYALFLRYVVDSALGHEKDLFWQAVIWLSSLILFQLLLSVLVRWLSEHARSSLENLFKSRLFKTLNEKDYASVSAIHSAEWLNRFTNDCAVVANNLVEVIPGFAEITVKLLSIFIMLFVLEPDFALILIPLGLCTLLLTWLLRKVMKRMHKSVQEADGKLRISLQENLSGLLMIHSFGAERRAEGQVSEKMLLHKKARMRKNRVSNVSNFGFGLAINGIYVLGIIWCGYGILTDKITVGTLTAVTQLIGQVRSPLASITGYFPRFYATLASAERLMEAEKLTDVFEYAPEDPEQVQTLYHHLQAFGLKDASFAYFPAASSVNGLSKEGSVPAIQNFTMEIKKGEYVAFTGSSGCGKSTVLKLLTCVYPLDGGERYLLDEKGTKKELTPSWRRLFAYVPQGNLLMSGSIRDVISFSDPNVALTANEDKLWKALDVACAKEFVHDLPDGLDTVLGERGAGLSEGQMQRLAIARAIYGESPILLLDEATSALDAQTERRVLQNLRNVTDRTVVIVTHRPAALDICDRVISFESK